MSPRTKLQNEEIRDKTKGAIKNAALIQFSNWGFHNTKVSAIAIEAGISKGSIYNYYENKEQILEEIILDAVTPGGTIVEQLINSRLSPREQLTAMVESTFKMMKEKFHYWKLLNSLTYQEDVVGKAEHKLKESRDYFINFQEELFEKMGREHPKQDTYLLRAAMDGIFTQYIHRKDEYPLDEMKDHLITKMLNP